MPNNKNSFNRYRYLNEMLSNVHRYYDIHDLTNGLNRHLVEDGLKPVSERCVQKDLKALQDGPYYAELERRTIEGKHIIRYADACFSIFSKRLTDDEESLLSSVLTTLGQFEGLDTLEMFDDLKVRLGVKDRPKAIVFESNPELTNRNMLAGLFTCITGKTPIRVNYRKFDAVRRTPAVIVHPYLLKQFNGRWYLFCGADEDGFIINYPIDRIESYEPLPAHPFHECEEDLEERFENIVGVTLMRDTKTNKPLDPVDVLLWVSDSEFPYLNTKPLYPYQRVARQDKEAEYRALYPHLTTGHFIEMNLIPNHEFFQAISVYFGGIEILQPQSLRNDFAALVKEMSKRYE